MGMQINRHIHRLESARNTLAELVEHDLVYLPIFARLDAELTEALSQADPIARARNKLPASQPVRS